MIDLSESTKTVVSAATGGAFLTATEQANLGFAACEQEILALFKQGPVSDEVRES